MYNTDTGINKQDQITNTVIFMRHYLYLGFWPKQKGNKQFPTVDIGDSSYFITQIKKKQI